MALEVINVSCLLFIYKNKENSRSAGGLGEWVKEALHPLTFEHHFAVQEADHVHFAVVLSPHPQDQHHSYSQADHQPAERQHQ